MTSASRASIYAWMQEGSFPRPRKLGNRRVAWLASEVEDWINGLKIAA
ncbi:MAG: AlpA family transcriptional regulator [Hyphomicrobium sp.]|nr:AlpA family transcriptional regulator [Hyphomicrobium sp.]